MDEGPGAILSFKTFFSLTGCQWLYNIQLKTSRGVLFLSPSDAYVRSFLYLLYTLIKLYYTKALSDPALSLAPDWNCLPQRPRIPASYRSATTFHIDSLMPSNLLCRSLLLLPSIFPNIWGLFKWASSSHQVAKILECQLQHWSFQWTPRTDLPEDGLVGSPCNPRDSQVFFNTTVQKHQFFCTQLSS